uniref:Uncharacterized protein n=1 Tax=Setaria italica TaxID=4555 RepID=K3XP30_SETIT
MHRHKIRYVSEKFARMKMVSSRENRKADKHNTCCWVCQNKTVFFMVQHGLGSITVGSSIVYSTC